MVRKSKLEAVYANLTRDKLINLLVADKLTHKKIGLQYGVSKECIVRMIRAYEINVEEERQRYFENLPGVVVGNKMLSRKDRTYGLHNSSKMAVGRG